MSHLDEELAGRLEEMPQRTGRITRIAATLFVLASLAFWIYAFSPLARERYVAVDGISDLAYRDQIELRCADAVTRIAELPSARSAASPKERANNLEVVNAELLSMMSEIGGLSSTVDDDLRLVGLWRDDWDIYLADRNAHVERLRTEGDVRFLNTEADGIFIASRMNGFARRNHLDSCETPGDL